MSKEYVHATKPYDHQLEWFEKTKDREHFAFFWEMGCGKTKPIIDTAGWLYQSGQIEAVVVLADKGLYLNWPSKEVPIHMSPNVNWCQATWRSAARRREQKALDAVMEEQDSLIWLFMNIEALSSKRAQAYLEAFLRAHHCLLVVDESTSIKSFRAKRTKAVLRLGRLAKYRRILTGTPITQSPLDLWSQTQFLQKDLLGFSSFVAFRSHYAVMEPTYIGGGKRIDKIIGYQRQDKLAATMAPHCSRIMKSDCLDLPPKIYEEFHVEMTDEQRRVYRGLKEELFTMIDGEVISVINALTMLLRLHQVTCGYVRTEDGIDKYLPHNRVDALKRAIEIAQPKGKVLIWTPFVAPVSEICEALDDLGIVEYTGRIDHDWRQENLRRFHDDPSIRAMVMTQSIGSKGLTLTEADLTVYYGNGYSLEKRLQSEDRNHRIGQHAPVTYIDLLIPGTVDEKVLKALKDKHNLAESLLREIKNYA